MSESEIETKECFGEQCRGCADFWTCPDHWGDGEHGL